MRIVDVSTMIGPWPLQQLEFETAEGLLEKMDFYGISEAYVYSSYAVKVSPLDGNYMLMDAIQGYEDRLKPCWVAVPTWDMEHDRKLEDELKKYNVKIVRLFPNNQSFSLESWICSDVYEMLQRNRIPLLLNSPDVSWNQLHAICAEYPDMPVILSQVEYQKNRILYKLLEKHPNLYLDVSTYYVYDGVEDIVKRFGAGRMLFGSRMPFTEAGAPLGMTLLADISDQEKEEILSGTIDRLVKEVRI